MILTKLKLGIAGAVVMAGVATLLVLQYQDLLKLREENQSLQQQVSQLTQLQAENERLSNLVAQVSSPPTQSNDQLNELLRLRSEVTRLRAVREAAQSKVAASGKGNARQNDATDDEAARLLRERDEASVKAEAAVKKMWEVGKGGREDALGFARKLRDEQAVSGSKLEAYKRYAATAREIEEKIQKEVEVGARSPSEADIAHFERLQAEVDLARITGRLPAEEK